MKLLAAIAGRFLPIAAGVILAAPFSAQLTAKIGTRLTAALGLAVVGIGLALLATLGVASTDAHIAGVLFVASLGMGLAMTPATDAMLEVAAANESASLEAAAGQNVLAALSRLPARQRSIRRPRTIGYFSRLALYRYQEYEAPRAQPRGSWFGRSARVRG